MLPARTLPEAARAAGGKKLRLASVEANPKRTSRAG